MTILEMKCFDVPAGGPGPQFPKHRGEALEKAINGGTWEFPTLRVPCVSTCVCVFLGMSVCASTFVRLVCVYVL